ncbi:MAG: hypothetical protein JKX69_04895 [Rhodobacteraceae bacterium]|nr:hypothetical protein [Paracoccaceae bacterium]
MTQLNHMLRGQASAEIDLCDGWEVAQYADGAATDGLPQPDAPTWLGAQVPGAVQYDLIRAKKLANPFASAAAVQAAEWVHDNDWLFRKQFDLTDLTATHLDVDGIDTFADIWLNGQLIGCTDNAYRAYAFALPQGLLQATDNTLLVHVKAHKRMVADLVDEAKERLGPSFKYKGLIRRYQRSFFAGSSLLNLGGEVLGIGIYKPLRLLTVPQTRITDVHCWTESISADTATLLVAIQCTGGATTVVARLIDPETGTVVAEARGDGQLSLKVAGPKLWWPRGYGAAFPYRLEVTVGSAKDSRMVGIRTSRIETKLPSGRPTFQIYINDTPIHSRGHNIIPIDYIKVHGDPAELDRLLDLTVASNANILRIWGGGAIEQDAFFARCDREGIMLWQDFYLHSNTYPDYAAGWVANYSAECAELLMRIRNHASIVVVCGGNEQFEGWHEWGWPGQMDRFYGEKLFTEVGQELADTLVPDLPYIINSPHDGAWCQSAVAGDVHNWGNFYNSTKDPLFVTETCWSQESYSRAETLEKFMDLDFDEFADTGWPERWKALTKRDLIARLPYLGGPQDFSCLRAYIKELEIEQALADHHALTNLLMRSTSLTGLVYWPLNKGGPLFQFGAVDYDGHPLASFYVLKRLFADQVVSIYRDVADIRIVAANRTRADFDGILQVDHLTVDGEVLESREMPVTIAAGGWVRALDMQGKYDDIVDRTAEAIRVRLLRQGQVVSEDVLFFCTLKEVQAHTAAPQVTAKQVANGEWELTVTTAKLASMLIVDGNQKWLCSANYCPLMPNETRKITVQRLGPNNGAPDVITVRLLNGGDTVTAVSG